MKSSLEVHRSNGAAHTARAAKLVSRVNGGRLGRKPAAGRRAAGKKSERRTQAAELERLQSQMRVLQQALDGAAQQQRRLCAPREYRSGHFEMACDLFPVQHLSGDFAKLLPTGERIGLSLGDIAGKGLAAGLWFNFLLGLLRVHAEADAAPQHILAQMNQDILRMRPEAPMTSLFFGWLDPWSGALTYANAGLPEPLVLRASGEVAWLQDGSVPLGALADASFSAGQTRLAAGDTLLLYSDGIVESVNERGAEFGADRLLASARSLAGSSARTMLYSVLGAVQDFSARAERADDYSLLVVRASSHFKTN